MATIRFENGKTVNFQGNPTPQDVEEVAKNLGISNAQTPAQPDNRDFLQKTGDVVNSIFPGKQLGNAVGNSLYGTGKEISQIFHGDFKGAGQTLQQTGQENQKNMGRVVGDTANAAILPASLALNPTKTILGTAAQFGAIGAASGGASSLAAGNDLGTAGKDALIGGGVGAATGGVFGLLGKGLAKAGPSMLSFTSGVPKEAIDQALTNPADAKIGLGKTVREVRDQATGSLKTLQTDLGKEFQSGLDTIKAGTGQTKAGMTYDQGGFLGSARKMQSSLTEYGRDFAREFRLGTKSTPDGIQINFDKSPIVKGGEKANVQEVFKTISNWDDFSAKGMQDLAERVGALRNFESGAKTESSAIVSKIYNKIAGTGGMGKNGLIPKFYPELATLRTNFAKNKTVLDQIDNVLNASTHTPAGIQSSVSRLDNLFKENKDTYLNVIKQLSDRSGTDYLSLLAGGEFQKVLPGFVRGLGGGGAVGVGASLLNPWLILLAPLFSPRAVGAITRNAPRIGKTLGGLSKGTASQIPRLFQSPQGVQAPLP